MQNEQKKVKVLDHPETFILIDVERNPDEAKARWLKKYNQLNRPPTIGANWKRKMHRTT